MIFILISTLPSLFCAVRSRARLFFVSYNRDSDKNHPITMFLFALLVVCCCCCGGTIIRSYMQRMKPTLFASTLFINCLLLLDAYPFVCDARINEYKRIHPQMIGQCVKRHTLVRNSGAVSNCNCFIHSDSG